MKVGDRVKRIFGRESTCDQLFRRGHVYTVCSVFHFAAGDDVRLDNMEGTFSASNFQLECKFKVGDRIIRTEPDLAWVAGEVYVIESMVSNDQYTSANLSGVVGRYDLKNFSPAPPEAPDPMAELLADLRIAQQTAANAQARFNAQRAAGLIDRQYGTQLVQNDAEHAKKTDPKRLGVAPRRIK